MAKPNFKSIAHAPPTIYPWQKPMPDKTTIGVIDRCYGSSHVVYGIEMEHYRHMSLPVLPLRKLDRDVTFFAFTPFIVNFRLPLVHTFNAVPLNGDFVVSFELELPRYLGPASDAQIRQGMKILASERCKLILPMSEFAVRFATRHFEAHGFARLADKMRLFRGWVPDVYPPGETRVSRAGRASFADQPLSAVCIGTQLFRKGGMYAIQAFENLRASGMNVTLTLLGDFETKSYAFHDYLPDAEEWRARARSHDWIRFSGPVPQKQVFAELLSHDICLYPSLDESLGWMPIEAGMLGVPVLGAKVAAFPELVADRETGWLVDVPLGDNGRWLGISLEAEAKRRELLAVNDTIVRGIEECCGAVYAQPGLLEQWGAAGFARTNAMYGMQQAGRELETIYDGVLGRTR